MIHNSHLVNALLCELSEMVPSYEGSQYLDLGTAYVIILFGGISVANFTCKNKKVCA